MYRGIHNFLIFFTGVYEFTDYAERYAQAIGNRAEQGADRGVTKESSFHQG